MRHAKHPTCSSCARGSRGSGQAESRQVLVARGECVQQRLRKRIHEMRVIHSEFLKCSPGCTTQLSRPNCACMGYQVTCVPCRHYPSPPSHTHIQAHPTCVEHTCNRQQDAHIQLTTTADDPTAWTAHCLDYHARQTDVPPPTLPHPLVYTYIPTPHPPTTPATRPAVTVSKTCLYRVRQTVLPASTQTRLGIWPVWFVICPN